MAEDDLPNPDQQVYQQFWYAPQSDPAFHIPPSIEAALPGVNNWEVRGDPVPVDPSQPDDTLMETDHRLESLEDEVAAIKNSQFQPGPRRRIFIAKVTNVSATGDIARTGPAAQWTEQALVNDARVDFLPRQSASYSDNSAAELMNPGDPTPSVGDFVTLLEELDPALGAYHYTILQGGNGAIAGQVFASYSTGVYYGKSYDALGNLAAAADCLVTNINELGGSNTGNDVLAANNVAAFPIAGFCGTVWGTTVITGVTYKKVYAPIEFAGCAQPSDLDGGGP